MSEFNKVYEKLEKVDYIISNLFLDKEDAIIDLYLENDTDTVDNIEKDIIYYIKRRDVYLTLLLQLLSKEPIETINKLNCPLRVIDISYDNDLALRLSVENGNFDMVKFLIENGADVHCNNEDPIYLSVINRQPKILKFLIEKGADVHHDEDWAIRLACGLGFTDIVELLIENGADPLCCNNECLSLSAQNNHFEIVELLLKNKATIHNQFSKKQIDYIYEVKKGLPYTLNLSFLKL